MSKLKKSIAIVLTLVMLMTYLPISGLVAFADDTAEIENVSAEADVTAADEVAAEEIPASEDEVAPLAADTPMPIAATVYNKQYGKEYYAASGTKFLSELMFALHNSAWYGDVSGSAEKKLTDNGYTLINSDLNKGAGGDYIFSGYKTSTTPSIRAIAFYRTTTKDGAPASLNYTMNGYSCKFEQFNKYYPKNGNSQVTGYLNLNSHEGNSKTKGSDYIYAFYTTDPNAGPPITDINVSLDDKGNTTQRNNGYTIGFWLNSGGAKNVVAGGDADLNSTAGGKFVWMYYKSSATEVNTTELRNSMNIAYELLNSGRNYSESTKKALQNALNAAIPVTNDYNDDGVSTSYQQTNIDKAKSDIDTALNNLEMAIPLDAKTNGGSCSTTTINVKVGTASSVSNVNVSAPKATKTGWEFVGWSTNSNATIGSQTTIGSISFNQTLYAIYRLALRPTYHFYDANGNAATDTSKWEYIYNNATSGSVSTVSPASVTANGITWNFAGWRSDSSATAPTVTGSSVTVNSTAPNVDYYAVYTATGTINYNTKGGSAVNPTSSTMYYGMNGNVSGIPTVTSAIPSRDGFTFLGWSTAEVSATVQYTSGQALANLTSGITLYAVYEARNAALKEDVIVLDFGLPLEIYPLRTDTALKAGALADKATYEIVAIATGFDAFADMEQNRPESGTALPNEFKKNDANNTTARTTSGVFAMINDSEAENESKAILYTPTSAFTTPERIYYAVEYKVAGVSRYLYGMATIVPATSVYYEDNIGEEAGDSLIDYVDGIIPDGVDVPENGTGIWKEKGNPSAVPSRLADYIAADGNYGYSDAYKDNYAADNLYSMGSAHYVEVSKYNNPNANYSGGEGGKWPYAQFTFAGTGFDVISVIGYTTGVINVQVYKEVFDKDATPATKPVYSSVVDNYYTYSLVDGEWVADKSDTSALYQIPVIHCADLEYGTYTVRITPTYTSLFDHENKGWYSFYLDAIRIYNPAGFNDAETNAQYAYDGERSIFHGSVRPLILGSNALESSDDNILSGAAFINLNNDAVTENGIHKDLDDYTSYGPNNEVYLAKGQAIAFRLVTNVVNPATDITSIKVSMHAPSVSGSAKAVLGSTNTGNIINVTSATSLYYMINIADITWVRADGLSADTLPGMSDTSGTGLWITDKPIIIGNIDGGMLAVCDIKVNTGNENMVLEQRGAAFAIYKSAVKEAEAKFKDILDNGYTDGYFMPAGVSALTAEGKVLRNSEAEITINTSSDVARVTVNGADAVLASEADGVKTWVYTYITGNTSGEETLTIVAYSASGNASDPIEITVDVQSRFERFIEGVQEIIAVIVRFFNLVYSRLA